MNILVVVCAILVCDTFALRLKREEKQDEYGLNPSICGTLDPSTLKKRDLNENELYPWFVGFGVQSRNGKAPERVGCIGSLITRKHIILPAHCLMLNNNLTIRFLGNTPTDKLENIKINKYITHENSNYKNGAYMNDIAIVTLDKPLEMSVHVHPICLPTATQSENTNYTGQEFKFTRLRGATSDEDVIEKVKAFGISEEKCQQVYNKMRLNLNNQHLCFQNSDNILSRPGNSGAPLMIYDTKLNRMSLIAYLTFGLSSDRTNLKSSEIPEVATRITPLIDWIRANSRS